MARKLLLERVQVRFVVVSSIIVCMFVGHSMPHLMYVHACVCVCMYVCMCLKHTHTSCHARFLCERAGRQRNGRDVAVVPVWV